LRRPRWPVVLAVSFAFAGAGVTYGWETDSGYFAFLPDKANPADKVVHVPGGKPPPDDSHFYFVDVSLLHANVIQKLWAEHLVEGADLVPEDRILAPGESEKERFKQDLGAMVNSQQVAQVVAERALGKPVEILRLGAQIAGVQEGFPADKAGIPPGDVVTQANGRPIKSASDLIDVLSRLKVGDRVQLVLQRSGTKTLRMAASPDDPTKPIIGVSVADAVKVGKIPVKVKFSTGSIGGPSAGLAFALEIYDALSGRQLLHGHRIAVTGTLDLEGGVGAIGGVKQKTIGAIDAGADVFLVPAGDNLRDAKAESDGRIDVIGVTSFQQALTVIRGLPPR
jgi:PDZ domain-containing protein